MKLPSYGRALLERRAAGKAVGLVVLSIGALMDRVTLAGEDGVSRLGVGPDADVRDIDFSPLVGLDVLVSTWQEQQSGPEILRLDQEPQLRRRDAEALREIWQRGRPGTLWTVDVASRTAALLTALRWGRRYELVRLGKAFPLNAGFRAVVAEARRWALIDGDGVFARAEFNELRRLAKGEWVEEVNAVRSDPVTA